MPGNWTTMYRITEKVLAIITYYNYSKKQLLLLLRGCELSQITSLKLLNTVVTITVVTSLYSILQLFFQIYNFIVY